MRTEQQAKELRQAKEGLSVAREDMHMAEKAFIKDPFNLSRLADFTNATECFKSCARNLAELTGK